MTSHDDDDAIPADLAALIAELPREIEPPSDLWEGIRAEIEPVPLAAHRREAGPDRLVSVGAWLLAGLAAAAAVAMVSAVVTASNLERPPRVGVVETVEALDQWETDVRQTTAELLVVLESRRTELDPEVIRVIETALADIDAAIADVRGALREDPGNDALEAALAGVYQRKVHLLRSATELPGGG